MTASDRRLDEIQARLNAATPGPWTLDRYDHGGGRAYVTDPKRRIVCDAFKENDREFLFNSASDMAYLLAELRKAHEVLAAVEEFASRLDAAASDDEPLYAKGKVSARASAAQLRAAVAAANEGEQ